MTHPISAVSSIGGALLCGLLALGCSSGGGGGGAPAPSGQVLGFSDPAPSPQPQTNTAPQAPAAPAPAPAPATAPSSSPSPSPTATPAPAPSPTPTGGPLFTEHAETIKTYVSSSTGNDSNPGTEALPLKTIAAGVARLRDGKPDWLLLKRGDTWDESLGQWRKSGMAADARMVVWAYGAGARPLLRTGASPALYTVGGGGAPTSNDHLAFSGLHFQAHTRIPGTPSYTGTSGDAGFSLLRGAKNVLLDDCYIEHYIVGINLNDFDGYGQTGIEVRRCVVVDAYAVHPVHAQGMFANEVDELLIEDCVFDRNGYNDAIPGAEPTVFNHNIYIQSNCRNVTVRRNILSRASSHGLQLRPGGTCEDNIVVRNPIGLLLGTSNTVPGGIFVNATGNVVTEGTDMSPTDTRGWGIDLVQITSATLRDNIVANITPAALASGNTFSIANDPNTTYTNNIVWSWAGLTPNHDSPGPFANGSAGVAAYAGSQGKAATFDAFIATCRAQSRASYDDAFSAASIKAYFVESFQAP